MWENKRWTKVYIEDCHLSFFKKKKFSPTFKINKVNLKGKAQLP